MVIAFDILRVDMSKIKLNISATVEELKELVFKESIFKNRELAQKLAQEY
jgi:hypothetical protein